MTESIESNLHLYSLALDGSLWLRQAWFTNNFSVATCDHFWCCDGLCLTLHTDEPKRLCSSHTITRKEQESTATSISKFRPNSKPIHFGTAAYNLSSYQNALALHCQDCFLYPVEWQEHPIIRSEVCVKRGLEAFHLAWCVEEAGLSAVVGQFLFTVFWLADDGRQLLLSGRVVEVDKVLFCLRRHTNGGQFCVIVLDHHPCPVLWGGEKTSEWEMYFFFFYKTILFKKINQTRTKSKYPGVLPVMLQ